MRNGNLLESCASEIRVKQIRVNQGVGVFWFVTLKKILKTEQKRMECLRPMIDFFLIMKKLR